MAITFNGNTLPGGITVQKFDKSVLPPVNLETITINGKDGAYPLNKRFESRVITVTFTIIASSYTTYASKLREFADFLYTEEPAVLILENEPSKYYLAIVTGVGEIQEESDNIGTLSIEFTCNEPFAFDISTQTPVSLNTDGSTTTVTNNGSARAYPLYEVEVDNDCTFIGIANNTTGQSVIVGSPVVVGTSTYNYYTTRFAGSLSSLTEMTQVPNSTAGYLDAGSITAQHTVRTTTLAGTSQSGYGVASGNYGTGTSWRGAVSEATLSTAQDNFSITWDIQYVAGATDTTARAELYLYDGTTANPSTATRMAKLTFMDSNDGVTCPQLYFIIYDGTGVGSNDILYSGTTGNLSTFVDVRNRTCTQYYNPSGLIRIRIARRSDLWNVYIAKIDPTDGDFARVLSQDLFQFNDIDGVISSLNMGYFYTSTLAYGTTTDPTEMIVHTLKVVEEDVNGIGTPYIFEDGDKVIINCETAEIFKNGVPFYTFLDPASDFPTLIQGDNQIVALGDKNGFINAQLTKNERYL